MNPTIYWWNAACINNANTFVHGFFQGFRHAESTYGITGDSHD